jgi:hypothetical protein
VRETGRKELEQRIRQNEADCKDQQLPLPVMKGSCKLVNDLWLRAKVRDEEDSGTYDAEQVHAPVNPVMSSKFLSNCVYVGVHFAIHNSFG